MSYKLYTDKADEFSCEVSVKNASLKNSIARLVVESDGLSLVFNGKIEGDKCIIPIKRLKGLLEENTKGNMHLEVIVEDTYFKPWQSDFIVEEHTSVKIKVNEHVDQPSNKPIVKVKVTPIVEKKQPHSPKPIKKRSINVFVPKKEIGMICEQFGIGKHNFRKRQKEFFQILKEYFKINPEYNYHARTILSGIDDFLK